MRRSVLTGVLACLAALSTATLAQEPSLMCFGNEPFWGLDLTEPGRAVFSTPDARSASFSGAATALTLRKEWIWRGRAVPPDEGELVAFLRKEACSDGMSDKLHPYAVAVSWPGAGDYAGCCRVTNTSAVAATPENASWRLVELPGQTLPSGRRGDVITARFEAGRVQGFSGCNQFTGSYTVEGSSLVLGNLAGTMMACAEPAMSVERQFLALFSGTLEFSITGDTLTLRPGNAVEALRFERQAVPELTGIEWEVTGYNNGRQAVVSPISGTRLTLSFQDGQVSGSSGCNQFHGAYSMAGNALTIHSLATTRKACEEQVMNQEREFLTALESATTWAIERGALDIHRADGERVLIASEAAE